MLKIIIFLNITIAALLVAGCSQPKRGTDEYQQYFLKNFNDYVVHHPEDGEANTLYGMIASDGRYSEQLWLNALHHGYDTSLVNAYLGALYAGYLDKEYSPVSPSLAVKYFSRSVELDPDNLLARTMLHGLGTSPSSRDNNSERLELSMLVSGSSKATHISFYGPEISHAIVCSLSRSGQLDLYNALLIDALIQPNYWLHYIGSEMDILHNDLESPPEVFGKYFNILDRATAIDNHPQFEDLALEIKGAKLMSMIGALHLLERRSGKSFEQRIADLRNELTEIKEKSEPISRAHMDILRANKNFNTTKNSDWKVITQIQSECSGK